jgi:peptide/nickel transport system ATP-binding protein
MTEVLSVRNLDLGFRTRSGFISALSGVNLSIREREIVGVVGESGCGKSLTALSIMGLLPESVTRIAGGSISFRGKNLLDLSADERRMMRGRDMAMIFQEPMTSLNPIMTVGQQIIEAISLHLGMRGTAARDHALDVLDKVGIPRSRNLLEEYPHQLSGGMRQRVMIAIALSCNPSLLIADEPTTALDVTIQGQILDLLRKVRDEFGTSILFITHDLGVVSEICDRVVVMYAGKVVETGDASDVLADPQHPYTRGLMRSVPSLDRPVERLATIPGTVPALFDMPTGCRFRSRCPLQQEICKEDPPVRGTPGREAMCWMVPELKEVADA